MADFGLTQALTGMYSGPSVAEKKNVELAQMKEMRSYFADKQKEKTDAANREMLYNQSVSAFADKLLAPDRDRLYEKARLMKRSVKDMVKQSGGDMASFFKNGGDQVMQDYKSAITESPESSRYLNNKENMTFILKTMNEGKGHLLSPLDKANYDAYFANKGGEITYSGMMTELKMPDPSKYDRGQKIPLQDILNLNRAGVLSNYSIFHKGTSLDPTESGKMPTDTDLLGYLALTGASDIGSDLSRSNQEETIRLNRDKEARDRVNQPYNEERLSLDNEQSRANIKQTEVNTLKTENDMLNPKGYDEYGNPTSGGNKTGGVDPATGKPVDPIFGTLVGEETTEYSIWPTTAVALTDINKDETIGLYNFSAGLNKYIAKDDTFKTLVNGDYKTTHYGQNYKGDGITDFASREESGVFGSGLKFSPTGAKSVYKKGEQQVISQEILKKYGATFDQNGKMVTGVNIKKGSIEGMYGSKGQSLNKGDNTLGGEFKEGGNLVLQDVILAGVYTNSNGESAMLMDSYKGGKVQPKDRTAMGSKKPQVMPFGVYKNEDGVLFYIKADPNDTKLGTDIYEKTKATSLIKQEKMRQATDDRAKAVDEITRNTYKEFSSTLRSNNIFANNVVKLSANANIDYQRQKFLEAYFAMMKSKAPAGTPLNNLPKILNQGLQSALTADGVSYLRTPSSEKGGPTIAGFFQKMRARTDLTETDKQLYSEWERQYNNLKNYK